MYAEAVKFIIFVIDGESNTASSDEIKHIDAFNEKLQKNGQWIMAAGIGAPETATVIDRRSNNEVESSGSLFGAPEYYSGFWIIDTASRDQALQLAREGSHACNRRVELRPFL